MNLQDAINQFNERINAAWEGKRSIPLETSKKDVLNAIASAIDEITDISVEVTDRDRVDKLRIDLQILLADTYRIPD